MKVSDGDWHRTDMAEPEDDEHILISCGPDNPPKEWTDGYYKKSDRVVIHQMSRHVYFSFPFGDIRYWMRVPEFPPFKLRKKKGEKP